MKKLRALLSVLLLLAVIFGTAACGKKDDGKDTGSAAGTETETETETEAGKETEEQKMKLGAYVWYGFSYEGEHYTDRLLNEFPGREPTWGWTEDSLENMAYQIQLAKEYGLSFFAFDWYYGNERLNHALTNFTRAEGHEDFEFCLNVCNHTGARIPRDKWEDACKTFVKQMKKPNALKVDGKPVIVFYDISNLVEDLGGTEGVKECFDYLRDQLKDYGGAYIIGCECPYGTPSTGAIDFNTESFSPDLLKKRLQRDADCGFDSLTGYNYRKYSPINGSYELTYDVMTRQHEASWDAVAKYGNVPYSPCILSGWDCRPWETKWANNPNGTRSCYAPDRTAEVFTKHILNAYGWLQENPEHNGGNLGFIYAWDEVCEGGFMIPTKGEGFKMLEGLKTAAEKIGLK